MPSQANQPLPDGYLLQNYRIANVLSCGGFSIVYLAYDENDQPVHRVRFFREYSANLQRSHARPATMTALVPPKAKELDSA